MRRILTLGLALCLTLSLAACGGDAPGNSPSPSPETPVATPDPAPADTPVVVTFTRDNFPRLNGSTSCVPLGEAVASVLLGESRDQVADLIQFSRTTNSFRALMAGESDLLIAAEPNAAVYDEMDEAGFTPAMEPFATDGLVFVVNGDNPVDSLTAQQLQDIYAGKITNWKEVGGEDREIIPFQRNEDAGSQALLKKLVMGDTPLMEPPAGYIVDSMMGLMEAVRSYDNSPGAIGYSVYYYANDMQMASGLKVIAVDGVPPSAATIRSGEYAFRNPYYVVMDADTPVESTTSVLYHWLLGPEGQRLVAHEGYVSVLEVK